MALTTELIEDRLTILSLCIEELPFLFALAFMTTDFEASFSFVLIPFSFSYVLCSSASTLISPFLVLSYLLDCVELLFTSLRLLVVRGYALLYAKIADVTPVAQDWSFSPKILL